MIEKNVTVKRNSEDGEDVKIDTLIELGKGDVLVKVRECDDDRYMICFQKGVMGKVANPDLIDVAIMLEGRDAVRALSRHIRVISQSMRGKRNKFV